MGFVSTGVGQRVDATAMRVAAVAGTGMVGWMGFLLSWVSAPLCVTAALGIALAAAIVGRSRDAVASLAVSAGVPVTAELLKLTLERPHLLATAAENSFPSGTVAAAAALLGAAVLASRSLARRVILSVGWIPVAVISVSVVVCSWHRPSDVAASLCLALVGVGLAWPHGAGPGRQSPLRHSGGEPIRDEGHHVGADRHRIRQ
jgi:membrane-associated phospholipid phosphatase